jgi:hypothetical protein
MQDGQPNGSDDVLYVKINNGRVLRKAILEVSKDMVIVLQRYMQFKEIRAKKLKLMEELSSEFAQIQTLTSKMETVLPKVKVKLKENSMKQVEAKVIKREEEVPLVEKEKSGVEIDEEEINKLEAAILEIEQKLSRMG